MASTIQNEFLTQLRRAETDVLKFAPSWERVLARERVVPSYRYDFNKIGEDIHVEVSQNATSGRRSAITRTRDSFDLHFFLAELDIPWVEEWFKEQHNGALPTPIQPMSNQEASRLVGEIRRKMDDYFWTGTGDSVITGMVDIDSSPTDLSSFDTSAPTDLSDDAGPKAFVKQLIDATQLAEADKARGRRVLAIDSADLPQLIRPYDDTASGPTALSMVNATVDEIVPVQNSAMDKFALLHYQNPDTAAWLNSIPNEGGVQVRLGRETDNQVLKIFHHAGFAHYRTGEGAAGNLGFYLMNLDA